MNWGDVGNFIGKAAPILGGLLGGPAGAGLGQLISSTLGTDGTPEAAMKVLQTNPDAMTKMTELQNTHEEKLTSMHLEAETARLAEINKTMRAELTSGDKFKSYWRPLFGYMVAITWFLQTVAIVYAVVAHPENAGAILTGIAALGTQWAVALAILGVNIHSRSNDKQTLLGMQPAGILGALIKK